MNAKELNDSIWKQESDFSSYARDWDRYVAIHPSSTSAYVKIRNFLDTVWSPYVSAWIQWFDSLTSKDKKNSKNSSTRIYENRLREIRKSAKGYGFPSQEYIGAEMPELTFPELSRFHRVCAVELLVDDDGNNATLCATATYAGEEYKRCVALEPLIAQVYAGIKKATTGLGIHGHRSTQSRIAGIWPFSSSSKKKKTVSGILSSPSSASPATGGVHDHRKPVTGNSGGAAPHPKTVANQAQQTPQYDEYGQPYQDYGYDPYQDPYAGAYPPAYPPDPYGAYAQDPYAAYAPDPYANPYAPNPYAVNPYATPDPYAALNAAYMAALNQNGGTPPTYEQTLDDMKRMSDPNWANTLDAMRAGITPTQVQGWFDSAKKIAHNLAESKAVKSLYGDIKKVVKNKTFQEGVALATLGPAGVAMLDAAYKANDVVSAARDGDQEAMFKLMALKEAADAGNEAAVKTLNTARNLNSAMASKESGDTSVQGWLYNRPYRTNMQVVADGLEGRFPTVGLAARDGWHAGLEFAGTFKRKSLFSRGD